MNPYGQNEVRLTGIDVPFWDLVWLLVKVTVAWIPAVFLLILIAFGTALSLSFIFGIDWQQVLT